MMLSDQELVMRLQAGDEGAFEELLERYREAIYRHVLGMVHDGDGAEDIAQEVFVRLWSRGEQWSGRGSFKTWLYRIATNLALNHLRTMKRRRQVPLELPLDDEENEPVAPDWMIDRADRGPEGRLEQLERGRVLRRLIERLPEEKREVVYLLHDAEMEMGEIAERLGIPQGTVKSRLHYATRRLAREWDEISKEWED